MATKCKQMGCKCIKYVENPSKWSKGKCKSCPHSRKMHANSDMGHKTVSNIDDNSSTTNSWQKSLKKTTNDFASQDENKTSIQQHSTTYTTTQPPISKTLFNKCSRTTCFCKNYIINPSKWIKGQCKSCNHSFKEHGMTHDPEQKQSIRTEWIMHCKYNGKTYTFKTNNSNYMVGDLQKQAATSIKQPAHKLALFFGNNPVNNYKKYITSYFNSSSKAITFQIKLTDYDKNTFQKTSSTESKVILLISTLSTTYTQNTARMENLFESKTVRYELLDGAQQENKTKRNQLFDISNIRAKYPQIFIASNDSKQIDFIGMDNDVMDLVDTNNFNRIFLKCTTRSGMAEEFIKWSKVQQAYYNKFAKLQEFDKKNEKTANNKEIKKLTQQILGKKSSGVPSNRDTLLHILSGAAANSGKSCLFFDSSQNIVPCLKHDQQSYLLAATDSDSAQFVLTLNNLQDVDSDEKTNETDKIIELKAAITHNQHNTTIENIRTKLGLGHNVDKSRIQIKDIFSGSFVVTYTVLDLTDDEKNKLINQVPAHQQHMQQLFSQYQNMSIHPALFHHTYDISMFDERGNKTFGADENGKYQVGPVGKTREYVQPTGWTRYGLKVLDKFSDGNKWLDPFQDPGNWYRAYHGTNMQAGASIYNDEFKPGSGNAYGTGIYCSPDINVAASYAQYRGGVKIETNQGTKSFLFVFQVAVNPETMNKPELIPNFNPACENINYWIAPTGADIRSYGILIKEIPTRSGMPQEANTNKLTSNINKEQTHDDNTNELQMEILHNELNYRVILNDTSKLEQEILQNEKEWQKCIRTHGQRREYRRPSTR
eukprot:486571_1